MVQRSPVHPRHWGGALSQNTGTCHNSLHGTTSWVMLFSLLGQRLRQASRTESASSGPLVAVQVFQPHSSPGGSDVIFTCLKPSALQLLTKAHSLRSTTVLSLQGCYQLCVSLGAMGWGRVGFGLSWGNLVTCVHLFQALRRDAGS